MRVWIILCHINIWTLLVINGYEYCITDKPVIDVCTISTGNNKDNVMRGVNVNTGNSPKITANVCRCTIMPDTMKTISLHITGDSILPTVEDKFMIKINNVTLNDLQGVTSVEINGETEFVYSSSIDFTGGFCLSIAPTGSDGLFSITCVPPYNEKLTTAKDTTLSSGHITNTASERTVSPTQTKPPNDANTDTTTNITLISGIIGSFVGVTVILAVIIAIVCCKRKRKSDFTQATAPHQIGNVNDGTNDGQRNAPYENCGEVLQMHTPENKYHYEELDIKNKGLSSNKDYSKLHF